MELKQNPFSVYDFLGYFTPGATFLYAALVIANHSEGRKNAVELVSEQLSFDKAEIYIPFVLLAYTLGHLLSFLSSITVERYSIWAHGYPSKYLLGMKHDGYFAIKKLPIPRWIVRLLVAALLLPVSLLDCVLGRLGQMRGLYTKSLDPLLIEVIRAKVLALMKHQGEIDPGAHGTAAGHDYFRFAYHYAVERAPNHLPKMQNYVALFGFLRTTTLMSVMFFWVMVWHVFANPLHWHAATLLLAAGAFSSFMFYMAFVKFYRRFSLEALMAVAITFRSK